MVTAYEKRFPPSADAKAAVQLSREQIREAGKQFRVELDSEEDYLSMRQTMSRDDFRDWVNACGYIELIQNTLAKGLYEDRKDGLWKQAIVRRYMTPGH